MTADIDNMSVTKERTLKHQHDQCSFSTIYTCCITNLPLIIWMPFYTLHNTNINHYFDRTVSHLDMIKLMDMMVLNMFDGTHSFLSLNSVLFPIDVDIE